MSDGALAVPRPRAVARRARAGLLAHPGRAAAYAALALGALAMLFPFAWMVSTSLKPDLAVFRTPPELLPRPFRPGNYARVVEVFPVWRFLLNSAVVAAASTSLQLLTSALGAYAFTRFDFRGRQPLFLLYLATLMVPFQVVVVPLFVEMRFLHLVDSYAGLVLPTVASAFGTFLLRQAFAGLPRDLEEAALVDGAGHFRVFWQVALPLVRPALATFGIFAFMASWNSFLWPFVITSSQRLATLPVGLANLQGEHFTAWNLVMAGTTISVVPIVLVYLLAQKHIVRGVVLSGVKG